MSPLDEFLLLLGQLSLVVFVEKIIKKENKKKFASMESGRFSEEVGAMGIKDENNTEL